MSRTPGDPSGRGTPNASGRVWVISELYYPEDTGTGHYMTEIAEGLAQHQHIRVICGQPTYGLRGTRAPRREVRRGVDIQRCWGTTLDKNVLPLKLVNAVSVSLSTFLLALRQFHRGDVVLVVTNPPALPFVVGIACWIRGARCILRIDDVYPEALVVAGILRPSGFMARVLDRLTRRLYRSADRIIVLGRDMRDLVKGKVEDGYDRIVVLPNWADTEVVAAIPTLGVPLRQELGLASRFVVGYAGNIGPLQGIESLLGAVERLRAHGRIHFLFVGWGKSGPWLQQASKMMGLTNMTILGQRPRMDQNAFLNAFDVAFVSLRQGMKGVGVPSRLYNILASGKPVIAVIEEESETARVVREEAVGWVVPPDSPERIADAILEAQAHPGQVDEMGRRARDVAERKYAKARIVGGYARVVDEVKALQTDG